MQAQGELHRRDVVPRPGEDLEDDGFGDQQSVGNAQRGGPWGSPAVGRVGHSGHDEVDEEVQLEPDADMRGHLDHPKQRGPVEQLARAPRGGARAQCVGGIVAQQAGTGLLVAELRPAHEDRERVLREVRGEHDAPRKYPGKESKDDKGKRGVQRGHKGAHGELRRGETAEVADKGPLHRQERQSRDVVGRDAPPVVGHDVRRQGQLRTHEQRERG
ncbi:hypothetical protein DFJ74DRAFT_652360 [Hyaloraphidium curvatum]|nr:hypothetical protein DFJ74DRAFT_652360 [Hyaloraphidium curvatum]